MNDAFSTFLARTDDAVYVVNADMVYLAASDSFAQQLGLPHGENLIGKIASDVLPDTSEARERIRKDMEALARGETFENRAELLRLQDGSTRYVLRSQYPVCGKDGKIDAAFCILHDATRAHEDAEAYRQEVAYLMQLRGDAYGAWLLDITAWRVEKTVTPAEAETPPVPLQPSLDAYLRAAAESVSPHQQEIQQFFAAFSKDTLTDMFHSGRRRLDFDYNRIMTDGDAGCI